MIIGITSLTASVKRIRAAPRDLDCDEPVSSEPASEKGGEDELRGEDHRRPGHRQPPLDEGLCPELPGRHYKTRRDEGNPNSPRWEGYGLEEGPEEREDECYREHLGECEPGGVVSHGVAGEESSVQGQSRPTVASAKPTLKKPRPP